MGGLEVDMVVSAEEAHRSINKNPYRSHPTPHRARNRLFPFATPAMKSKIGLPASGRYAVAGDCFARSIEESLRHAGLNVISSPIGRGMPGNRQDQIGRFIKFHLDVFLQELRFLIGVAEQDFNAPIIEVKGEYIDLMIGVNFAHDQETARRYRSINNQNFLPFLDADIIVLVAGGVEQWFDKETGLYVNGFVPGFIIQEYPGRFELHRISCDRAAQVVQEIINIITQHSKRTPHFVLCNSSAFDAATFFENDILLEHVYSRSVQRVALEKITLENDSASYLPALEFLLLSDRDCCYQQTNLSHTTNYFTDRVISEMMRAGGLVGPAEESLRVRGTSGAFVNMGRLDDALEVVNAFLDTRPDPALYRPDMLTVVRNELYTKLGIVDERIKLHLANCGRDIPDGTRFFSPDHSYQMAMASARSTTDIELMGQVIDARDGRELTEDNEKNFTYLVYRRERLIADQQRKAVNPPEAE